MLGTPLDQIVAFVLIGVGFCFGWWAVPSLRVIKKEWRKRRK